ncbi:DNA-binding transcriptional MerR regulator [Kitasatospora gansuensis]|uniref:DNA-binding transcriptional MerR regulator n=1 Tax=Kitasatospora gansuensis TaxID=258050 RepID=A0A7W7SC46_9ACTN|nr:MerR family transcriptional regulator [Kitasatospora gansuensis]MBB4947108.1 DNA-binding transcriptional MerR regulator [Kitasatospora gansuensis]
MFSIGDFAKHGRVSVRMLRHYDAIGLLPPARVDPFTGYRGYEAAQLARLNRIIALKDLGFTLQQVTAIVDEQVSAEELRGMLRLRQAELAAAVQEAAVRLARVESRLRTIESEGRMPSDDVVVKSIPAVRVARLSAVAESFDPEHIGPVIGPLFDRLCRLVDQAGLTVAGPSLAYYEEVKPGTDQVRAFAALPVNAEPDPAYGFEIADLPALPSVATIVHRGPMDDVLTTSQTLARWIDANGHRSLGLTRELYLELTEDRAGWVTELQEPITTA